MRTKKIFVLLTLAASLAACAGTDNEIEMDRSLREIYETAYEEFNDKNYETAAAEFLKAESQYPSSPWAADALVMAAYSHYIDKDFAGAILVVDRFMRFHPGHKDVPYMLYLRGMCYYRQVSDVRREPGMSAYALQQFQQLVERFPRSEYAKNAENKFCKRNGCGNARCGKERRLRIRGKFRCDKERRFQCCMVGGSHGSRQTGERMRLAIGRRFARNLPAA